MTLPSPPDAQGAATRPYLIRALHEWCTDNGFTPYLAVHVDGNVQVPVEYVKNGEIVLNVGFDATQGLKLGNEVIEFRARFGGVAREIVVPVDHVIAIYARENGQGMAFPTPSPTPLPIPTPGMAPSPGALTGVAVTPRPNTPAPKGAPERVAPTLRLATPETTLMPSSVNDGADPPPPEPSGPGRPALKRVK